MVCLFCSLIADYETFWCKYCGCCVLVIIILRLALKREI